MKNIIKYVLFLVIGLTIPSCKKEEIKFHKIKFEVNVFEGSDPVGTPVMNSMVCSPYYKDEAEPAFPTTLGQVPYTWDYEYWQLVDSEPVVFSFSPSVDYMFEMLIYIDGVMVSRKVIDTSNSGDYYAYQGIEQSGLDESGKPNYPVIKFTYHE